MKKKKVYLAKSNHANPNKLISLRNQLKDLGVEIVEYKGGQYSNKALLECEYLIVLPSDDKATIELENELMSDINYYDGEEKVIKVLGKGLYTQIEDFCNLTKYSDNVYIIFDESIPTLENDYQWFYCGKHGEIDVYDEHDYINYGYSVLSSEKYDTTIDDLFGGNKVQSTNQYMYLLAKR